MKRFLRSFLVLMVVSFFFVSSASYAKPTSDPKGGHKGKKTGWKGQNTPPGLSKKEAKKKAKAAKKGTDAAGEQVAQAVS